MLFRSDAEIMNKNADNTAFENFLENMRRRIMEVAAVPDYESINAQNSEISAKAMMQRLRPMEDNCKVREDKLRTAIRYFIRIFIRYAEQAVGAKTELKDYEITFKRNGVNTLLIENINDFLALKSTGLFSDETLLSFLPFVGNPANILSKRDTQLIGDYGIDYLDEHMED